jgi:hypothetical protein
MSRHVDEEELRALFGEIAAPPGLDRWRERITDLHAETCAPNLGDTETNGATILAFPTGHGLRRTRSVAVAAAAAVVVGLGGVVVTSQLLSDAPPADDPTMIIDGPDRTASSSPPTLTSEDLVPSGTATTPPRGSRSQDQPTPGTAGGSPQSGGGGTTGANAPSAQKVPRNEPVWPKMTGDPTYNNTGVPIGTALSTHNGDLRITTAGEVVSDLRVTGSVIVDAPNVTLKRVLVIAPYGALALRQNADNLTVENSQLTGGTSLTQSATGLVVRRSKLENGVTITSGAELYDCYLAQADVVIPAGSTTMVLRHNVMGRVTMNDLNGPIRGVTIENSVLTQVHAPTQAGSASVHVLANRFRDSAPSTGWNSSATDFRWSDNTFMDSGAPANP